MTQSKKPTIYRQMLALLGQVQLRQERLELKLDKLYLKVSAIHALAFPPPTTDKDEASSKG